MDKKASSTRPTALELFAGAGGLALGIEKAGFDTIGLVEIDADAVKTLRANRQHWNVVCADIADLTKADLHDIFGVRPRQLDLLSGGAPCQSFSYAGNRLGLEDARGTLFYHFALFLQRLQPKVFLFENVRGLLTHDNGVTYNTIVGIFEQSGYTIQQKLLNAWNYGVAQKRERLIMIGVRTDLATTLKVVFPNPHAYKPVLRDVLQNVPISPGATYSEYKKALFDLVPQGGYWRDIPVDLARKYMKNCWGMSGGMTGILRRMSMDEPALTVLTSPSQKQTERCHPTQSRPFTVRENARCQGFDDDWVFCGSLSSQYRQVGNAVPVGLAYEVAAQIYKGWEAYNNGLYNKERPQKTYFTDDRKVREQVVVV
jgi:DNA (cytosine-5)-methyltransferase 1